MGMKRRCDHCQGEISGPRNDARKFCSDACKQAAYRVRRKSQNEANSIASLRAEVARQRRYAQEARDREHEQRLRREAAERAAESIRSTGIKHARDLDRRKREVRRLKQRIADLEMGEDRQGLIHQREEFRNRLTEKNRDLHLLQSKFRMLESENKKHQRTDETWRDKYVELRDKYADLGEEYNRAAVAVNDMSKDRDRFRPVIKEWDILAGRLAAAAKGHTKQLCSVDHEILRHWSTWKQGVLKRQA